MLKKIFVIILVLNSVFLNSYELLRWYRENGVLILKGRANTSHPENHVYHDKSRGVWYFKGNSIYLYTSFEDKPSGVKARTSLNRNTTGDTLTLKEGVKPFDVEFRGRANIGGWTTVTSKTLSFCADTREPNSVLGIHDDYNSSNEEGKYLYLDSSDGLHRILYYNTLKYTKKIPVKWSKPTDSASGVEAVYLRTKIGSSVYDVTNAPVLDPTGARYKEFSISEIKPKVTFNLEVYDYVGYSYKASHISLIEDIVEPTFSTDKINYFTNENSDYVDFDISISSKDVVDNIGGSGIMSYYLYKKKGLEEIFIKEDKSISLSIAEKRFTSSKQKFFNRDESTIVFYYFRDNVFNKSRVDEQEIMLSAAATIDDGGLNDWKKAKYVYKNGELFLEGYVDLGNQAAHPTLGVEQIDLYLVKDQESSSKYHLGTIGNILDSNLKIKVDQRKDSKDVQINGKEVKFSFPVKVADWGLEYNKAYIIDVQTTHKGSTGANPVRVIQPEVREYRGASIPTRPIAGSVIEVNGSQITIGDNNLLKVGGDKSIKEIVASLTPQSMENMYVKDSFIVKALDKNIAKKLTFEKVDIDENGVNYLVLKENYTVNRFDNSGRLVEEEVSESYVLTSHKFTIDSGIDTKEVSVLLEGNKQASKTKNVKVKLNRVPDDLSGINEIIYFNIPNENIIENQSLLYNTVEIGKLYDKLYHNNSNDIAINRSIDNLDIINNLEDLVLKPSNDAEGKAYVSARLKDRAGNISYLIPSTIVVDAIPPEAIYSADLSYSYSFLNNQDIVKLSLDTTYKVSAKIGGLPCTIVNNEIVIPLVSTFIPNKKVDIEVTLEDEAGNITINNLWYYTPAKITSADVEFEHKWDNELGNTLTFKTNIADLGVSVYKENKSINNRDIGLESHSKHSYTYYSVNGSGYENQKSGTFEGPVEVLVPNNKPVLTITNGIDTKKDGITYIGPNSEISFDVKDNDNDLVHAYVKSISTLNTNDIFVDGTNFTLGKVFGNDLGLLSENGLNKLSLGVQDFWGVNESGAKIWQDIDFKFDRTPPVINKINFESKDLYTFVNGNLLFNISDSGVGLDLNSIEVVKTENSRDENLTVTSITDPVYTHKVILPEGVYDLSISSSDRLGNKNIKQFDKPIIVDRTSPIIKSVKWGDNPNLIVTTNTLSSRNSNFVLDWKDNVSSPVSVEFKIVNSGVVKKAGIIDVKGLSEPAKPEGSLSFNLFNDLEGIIENSNYELIFKVIDRGGNSSVDYNFPFVFKYDLTPPDMKLVNWALKNRNGKFYTNTDTLPEPNVLVTDSSVVVKSYKLYDLVNNTLTSEVNSINMLIPALDGEYELHIIAEDESKHKSILKLPFVLDRLAPETVGMELLDVKKSLYRGGEQVSAKFTGLGVSAYYYQVIDQTTNQILSNSIQGAVNGWVKVDSSISGNYKLTLPRSDNATKVTGIVKIKAEDFAGNLTAEIVPPAGNFVIDSSGEYINVGISPWIGSNKKLIADWTYYPGLNNTDSIVNSYKYEVYVDRNGVSTLLSSGITQTPSLDYQITELISPTDSFYIKVIAVMSSSRETLPFESSVFRIDTDKPVINSVIASNNSTKDNISIQWDISENLNISSVKASVSWSYLQDGVLVTEHSDIIELGNDIKGRAQLTSLGNTLIKTGDRVKVNLIVEDGAGNIATKFSNEILIDNTPPPEFVVEDQGDYVNPAKNPSLKFNWIWSIEDTDSPISEVYYQVTKGGVITDNWTQIDKTLKEVTVPIPEYLKALNENGSTLVLAVKKVNSAGLHTIGYSNGIVLDSTAGRIVEAVFTFRNSTDPRKFFTNKRDLTLWVSGYDKESGISRITGELGSLSGDVWVNQNSGIIDEINHDGKLDITLPNVIRDSDRFRYKVIWYNKTDTPSQPFYTRELVFNPKKPEIVNINGSFNNNVATVTWDHILQLPFKEGKVILKSKDVTKEFNLTDNLGLFSVDTQLIPIPDGEYNFSVELFDVAGGTTGLKVSNSFVKDSNIPHLVSLDSDTYVSKSLSFTLKANENLSYYSYKVGTVSNDSLFSGNWVEGQCSGNSFSINNFDLTRLGDINLVDQSCILLTVKFADNNGNWSDLHSALIRVDLTAPGKPEVKLGRNIKFYENDIVLRRSISFSDSQIKNVKWTSSDNLSHIKGYKYAVVGSTTALIPENQWSKVIPVDRGGSYAVDIKGLVLNNSDKVYVALKAINGAGLESEVGYSEEIQVDTVAPEYLFSTLAEAGKTIIDGVEYSTFNGNSDIGVDVGNEVSSHVYANVKIFDPHNKKIVENRAYKDLATNRTLKIPFSPTSGVYGNYTIEFSLEDPGLNRNTSTKVIRYNPPPIINNIRDVIILNPLRPHAVNGADWFSDPDGIKHYKYTVLDGAAVVSETTSVSSYELVLGHKNISSSETLYTLKVEAYDMLNNVSDITVPIKVVNTSEGTLYTDEVWSGNHKVIGTVVIPAGRKLTIETGSVIKVDTNSVNGYDQSIIVEENGTLIHNGAAKYFSDDPYGKWDGLKIYGTANLSNIHVENANRGITIDSSLIYEIKGATLIKNTIGIHLVKAGSVTIEDSIFKLNSNYGIKEEKGVDPVVIRSRFTGNGYDYYDSILTVIDYAKLNNIISNSGNLGE